MVIWYVFRFFLHGENVMVAGWISRHLNSSLGPSLP